MRRRKEQFWDAKQEWSRRKHLVLEYYLSSAIGKLRRGGGTDEVFIYDAFAGRGEYRDGRPGSPVLLAQVAEQCAEWKDPVSARIILSEANKKTYDELCVVMASWIDRGIVQVLRGSFESNQAHVLEAAQGHPLFVFLDPFKPKELPFESLAPLLVRRELTEVLIVFFSAAIARVIATLNSGSKASEKQQDENIQALDRMFGGSSWRAAQQQADVPAAILRAYMEFFRTHLPYGSSVLPHSIEARYGEDLKYHLIFLTKHRDGLMLMNDAYYKERAVVYQDQHQLQLQSLLLAESTAPTVELGEGEQQRRAEFLTLQTAKAARALLSRSELIHRCMVANFGEFSKTEWRRAVGRLVARTSGPRLEAPGALSWKGGAPQLNDVVRLRYTE